MVWWILGAIFIVGVVLMVFSLCKVASDSDDNMERLLEERKTNETNVL